MTTDSSMPFRLIFASLVVSCVWLLRPIQTEAQSQGNNAVFNANSSVVGSSAFIDAIAFSNGSTDICHVLYSIISANGYPLTGAVVDARGFNVNNAPNDGNGNLTCAYSPWNWNGTITLNPATVLLPLTRIVINQTWTLPNGSKIMGKGLIGAIRPSLQAVVGFSQQTPMIQMGTSCPTGGCTGVSVEHVTLDANNQPIDVIDNLSSQEQSYVDDVFLENAGLTGLKISAPNSGPYSNIRYLAYQCSITPRGCPVCVDIEAQTKGLHGITCIGNGVDVDQTPGDAAIYVNASNNSIEDVHVEAFWDAIEVGNISSATVSNVTIANVTAAANSSGRYQNVIHICGPHFNTNYGQCNITTATIKDVTILQAVSSGTKYAPYASVLQDDVTGTTVAPGASLAKSSMGMYVLGEPVPGSSTAYSRFSVSPNSTANGGNNTNITPWGVGAPTTVINNASCSTPGALYSNTNGSSGSTIFVCTNFTGTLSWHDID